MSAMVMQSKIIFRTYPVIFRRTFRSNPVMTISAVVFRTNPVIIRPIKSYLG